MMPRIALALLLLPCILFAQQSIYDIQYTTDASGNSPLDGVTVQTGGVVTAINYNNQPIRYFIADRAGGLWRGILVNDNALRNISVGDSVSFEAQVQESNSQTRLYNIAVGSFFTTPAGVTVPPALIETGDVGESSEGVLVEFSNAVVTSVQNNTVVDDGSGPAAIGNGWDFTVDLIVGDTLTFLRGLVSSSANVFSVNPRGIDDISFLGNHAPVISQISHTPETPTSVQAVSVTAMIFDEEGVIDAEVRYRFGEVGGFAVRTLFDDGLHGDGGVGDGIWGGMIPAGPERIAVHFYLWAEDTDGAETVSPIGAPAETFEYIVRPATFSIFDIQYTGDPTGGDSPFAGQIVTVTGIVTAENFRDQSIFIADPGGGIWSGVYVFDPPTEPARGDCVRVTGVVSEYSGLTELSDVASIENLGPGTLPEPVETTYENLFNLGEPYEGVLTRISEPCMVTAVTGDYLTYGQIDISGGGLDGVMMVDDDLEYTPEEGDSVCYWIGCGYYNHVTGYMLAARDDADVGFIDRRPPQLLNAQTVSLHELNITVDERLSPVGIHNLDNYTLIDVTHPEFPQLVVQSVSLFSNGRTLHLTVLEEFIENYAYSLTIDTLRDLAGNELLDGTIGFLGYHQPLFTPITSIYDSFSVYSGQAVMLRGVISFVQDVTTTSGSRRIAAYIQDESGRGFLLSQSGPASDFTGIQRHNLVSIVGTVISFAGAIQLNDFTHHDITLLNEGLPLPTPIEIGTGDRETQDDIISTSFPNLFCSGTWCTTVGTVNRVDEHIGGGTNIYVNDGSGDLVVRVWDDLGIDSVNIDGIYYRLGNELVGVECRISGPAYANDGEFQLLAGYMEDIVGMPVENHHSESLTEDYSLSQNYPNPFNPSTTLVFSLPRASDVSICAFDILGREVESLVSGTKPAGTHSVVWECLSCASGVYLVVMEAPQFRSVKKAVLLR